MTSEGMATVSAQKRPYYVVDSGVAGDRRRSLLTPPHMPAVVSVGVAVAVGVGFLFLFLFSTLTAGLYPTRDSARHGMRLSLHTQTKHCCGVLGGGGWGSRVWLFLRHFPGFVRGVFVSFRR